MFRRRVCAFTLVELMVVMAVISILAALLLPALQKSLSAARQTACMSNQKQAFLALTLYGNESRYYPACWRASFGASADEFPYDDWMTWAAMLLYEGCFGEFGGTVRSDFRTIEKPMLGVLHCPANTERDDSQPSSWPKTNVDYGLNGDVHGEGVFVRPGRILRPNRLFFAGEVPVSSSGRPAFCYINQNDANAARHDGGMNVLYHDGHAVREPEVAYTATWQWQRLPWFNATESYSP